MAVTDKAITAIKQMIVDGSIGPGDRLPPEKELSESLGLSRNSLREAVKALELIRVLDVRQGDGTYVTSLEPSVLLEALGFVVELHRDSSVLELFEVRRVLEPTAVELACDRLDDATLDQLDRIMEPLHEGTDVESLVAADISFHRIINAACGNAYMSSLLDGIAHATVRGRVWRGITETGAVAKTLDEHRAILDALRARRRDLARAWAAVHVAGAEMWLSHAALTGTEGVPLRASTEAVPELED
ncbi:FadR/GntR family transcriptional regulator [Brachybacterium phenoliresistens]|uniref:GntR family transcriptional regulator n=1 Tax=Brachybacterium phenoliresistens TaxID=396014 RepID=Z9JRF5_9MICO|nr:FCD domain-containing protein [Brachybacterium phenoliresistens]EWS80578.1 GntR family transcriptional regulator [Brachybacterium phenoliresistens]